MRNLNWKPECPINWNIISDNHKWVSMDNWGDVYSYRVKPKYQKIGNEGHGIWESKAQGMKYVASFDVVPVCPGNRLIWKRP
jgi:hypothetical protein